MDVNGATTLNNTLTVNGATTLNNTLKVTGKSTLNELDVNGATTLNNTLTVNGATTLNNTLKVTGKSTLNELDVNGATTLNNTLKVTGATTLDDNNGGKLIIENGSSVISSTNQNQLRSITCNDGGVTIKCEESNINSQINCYIDKEEKLPYVYIDGYTYNSGGVLIEPNELFNDFYENEYLHALTITQYGASIAGETIIGGTLKVCDSYNNDNGSISASNNGENKNSIFIYNTSADERDANNQVIRQSYDIDKEEIGDRYGIAIGGDGATNNLYLNRTGIQAGAIENGGFKPYDLHLNYRGGKVNVGGNIHVDNNDLAASNYLFGKNNPGNGTDDFGNDPIKNGYPLVIQSTNNNQQKQDCLMVFGDADIYAIKKTTKGWEGNTLCLQDRSDLNGATIKFGSPITGLFNMLADTAEVKSVSSATTYATGTHITNTFTHINWTTTSLDNDNLTINCADTNKNYFISVTKTGSGAPLFSVLENDEYRYTHRGQHGGTHYYFIISIKGKVCVVG